MENNINQNPVIDSPQPTITVSQPKNSKSFLWFSLGILITLLIIGIIYFVNNNQTKTSVNPTPLPMNTSVPTPDPTVNWKIYNYSNNEFSFKYPTNWFIEQKDVQEGGYINFFIEGATPNPTVTQDTSGNEVFRIIVYGDETIFNNLKNNTEPGLEVFSIANKTALKGINQIDILIGSTNKRVLHLEFKENSQQYLDQILSTFKFLDETGDTSNWKKYTSLCGFSVKYPDGWNAQKFFVLDSTKSCAFLTAPDYKQGSDTRTGFSITLTRLIKGSTNQDTNYKAAINTTDDYIKSTESLQQPLAPIKNKIPATYGSLSGTQFDYDAFESTTTFVFLQNNYFWIINWPTTSQYNGQYRENLDQILSTIKFTE